jgi:hypothetical protein
MKSIFIELEIPLVLAEELKNLTSLDLFGPLVHSVKIDSDKKQAILGKIITLIEEQKKSDGETQKRIDSIYSGIVQNR